MEPPTTPVRRGKWSSTTAPTIALPHRRSSWRWPVACVLAVLYVSLLPFDFTLTTFQCAISDGLLSLRFRSTTPDDAAANLLVYLMVGLVVGFCAMRSRCGRWGGALLAVAIGTSLSILVETLQTGLLSRVASCTDILLNGFGAAIGGCLGVGLSGSAHAAIAQLRCELADRPFTTAASLLTLGLFLYNLAPFDFVKSTDALHASFGRAHWRIMDAGVATVGTPPFAALAYQLTGAGWFGVLGYLLGLAGRERRLSSAMSLGAAFMDGLILIVVVEFMQLFTQSHTFEAASILLRSSGVLLGAWCAVFLIDSLSLSAWRHRPRLAVPTSCMSHNHSRVVVLMATFALLQIGLLIAPCLNLQNGLFPGKRDWVVQWLPFAALRGQPFLTAAVDVLSSMVIFGTLTLTLVVLLRRMRAVYANWWALAALTLISITRESLRFSTFGTPMDMTTLLVAWSSAYLVIGPLRVMEVAAAVRGAAASGLGSAPELRYIELTKRSFRR